MKILFLEDEILLRELFPLDIEAELGVEVLEAATSSEAISLLKENRDVCLILSDIVLQEGSGEELYKFVRKEFHQIPFILITGADDLYPEFVKDVLSLPQNRLITKPCRVSQVITEVCSVLGIYREKKEPEFCRVKIERLVALNSLDCDLHIQIGDHYVKIMNKGEQHSIDDILSYQSRGIKYLYLKTDDYLKFCNDYIGVIDEKVAQSSGDVIVTSNEISFIHEMINNLGITKEVVQKVDRVIEDCVKQFSKTSFSTMLSSISKKRNFLYEHSLLAAYISTALAHEMSWVDDQTVKKLVLASLLHDVTLDELVPLLTFEIYKKWESDFQGLDWKTQRRILSHPHDSVSLIIKSGIYVPDLEKMVESHHEVPGGTGYPRKINASELSQISCLFNLSDRLATDLYGSDEKEAVQTILKLKNIYSQGNFLKPYESLLALVKKDPLL